MGDARPHVTEILKRSGLVDTTWFSDEVRDRGTIVHEATEFLDQDDLDWESLEEMEDPSILLRVRQYEKFKRDTGIEILKIELPVTHRLGYVGRLDRVVILNARKGILDIKGTTESPWHGVQLAAYAACFNEPLARWNLYLKDDAYRLRERTNPRDFDAFKAAMVLAQWKETT